MKTWYKEYKSVYNKPFSQVSDELVHEIHNKLQQMQSQEPVVTVSVIAYNEEERLLACLWSLSEMSCKYPMEIIGVNNNSQDDTEAIFKKLGVPYFNEPEQSPGHARQCGLDHARGKYFINIDADTMYPPKYVELMVSTLEKERVVAVGSFWSYFPDKSHSWLSIKLYEFTRDCYLWALHFNRPELTVRGMVFGHDTVLAKQYGFRTNIIRGEDGSLAKDLIRHGKIIFLYKRKARAVTGYGTVGLDGSFFNSFWVRAKKAVLSIKKLFTKKDHYEDEESNLIK